MITAQTRIIPISKSNQVRKVTKLDNGDLSLEFHSGKVVSINKDDKLFQAFVIWTVLNKGF